MFLILWGLFRVFFPHSEKKKSKTDKWFVCSENSGVKLKELMSSLGGLVLSDADVVSVVSLLRDKSPNALDSWYKVGEELIFSMVQTL